MCNFPTPRHTTPHGLTWCPRVEAAAVVKVHTDSRYSAAGQRDLAACWTQGLTTPGLPPPHTGTDLVFVHYIRLRPSLKSTLIVGPVPRHTIITLLLWDSPPHTQTYFTTLLTWCSCVEASPIVEVHTDGRRSAAGQSDLAHEAVSLRDVVRTLDPDRSRSVLRLETHILHTSQ